MATNNYGYTQYNDMINPPSFGNPYGTGYDSYSSGFISKPGSSKGVYPSYAPKSAQARQTQSRAQSFLDSDNPFMDYLELRPETAYYSSQAGRDFAGRSPTARGFYERNFGNIYNQYLGKLGEQIRGLQPGEKPTLRWTDYLEQDPFTARFTSMPPTARGQYTGSYAPATRRIYF